MHKSFIETQFPVSKLSKESYKDRKANQFSQTLTGLGKWWGRKPLILVRATILGLLMPASADPKQDRDIFLKLLTMDSDGMWLRRSKSITVAELYKALPSEDQNHYFTPGGRSGSMKYKRGVTTEDREALQHKAFDKLIYDEKLALCFRPEQIEGPSEVAWADINAHLGTTASNLPELIKELGKRRFGHVPRVGDVFCGGGSIPVEAARIGCDAFASDLNPVAALLTWGGFYLLGGNNELHDKIRDAQKSIYEKVDRQISEWKIETNVKGWRADTFLYCAEVFDPETGYQVPCIPSLVVASNLGIIAELIPDHSRKRFEVKIKITDSADEIKKAKISGTWNNGVRSPLSATGTSVDSLRGPSGLRLWEKDDFIPRSNDVFQERLYCIRWVETYTDENGDISTRRHYLAPTEADLASEEKVQSLLIERFSLWQQKGYIPIAQIESGYNTDQPIHERGWTYWHHLFNPRQLLIHGLILEAIDNFNGSTEEKTALLLWMGICCNFNSRISRWEETKGRGLDAFSNQALNTLMNYACRGLLTLNDLFNMFRVPVSMHGKTKVEAGNASQNTETCDLWITDPPYADAINYHELSEFYLSWYQKTLQRLFPDWPADSRRVLAVRGADESFRRTMVECYSNLAHHMPDDGMQVVMFTHQDAGVWADLALILWAAGLQVTAAWTVATETDTAMKSGNYVQGTVLLVLRKRVSEEIAFLDDITHEIRPEVERQLQSMLEIEDKDDPNFSDSDYQLAAYAAALRVLTKYKHIEDLNVARELARPRQRGVTSPIKTIIENGVKIASNFLIPRNLHDDEITRRDLWRNLTPEEKFYLKGLEVESHGDYRQGVYQEFAKGFGLQEYTNLLESGRANETRLKTAGEFKRRELGAAGFGATIVRNILFAVYKTGETERTDDAIRWLKDELPGDYWQQKQTLVILLRYLSRLPMEHWKSDAHWAGILAGSVENDGV
jgi:adenine-specific DNA methylase